MNTRLLTVLVIAGAGTFGGVVRGFPQGQSSPPSVNAPEVSIPRSQFAELVHDFGRINSGAVVKHEFVFTNMGSATLEITDVRPGCGCTAAGSWDRRVEPGKTGVIPLQFDSTGFNGTVAKTAIVICNDPAQTNVVLQIKATIWNPIEATPTTAVFNVFSESQTNETRVVRILNNLDEPVELSDLQCTNRSLQADLKTVRPGKEFELRITASPPFTSNTIAAPVSVKTSSPRMPMLTVNAYIIVQQAVIVAPNRITLPTGRLTASMSQSVKILNKGTNALALSDARVNTPRTEVRLQEIQPGRVFSLMVNFPEGFEVTPGKEVEVSVRSNHPQFPLIKVPVIQQAPIARAAAQPVPVRPSTVEK
jgi:hypothetical protein